MLRRRIRQRRYANLKAPPTIHAEFIHPTGNNNCFQATPFVAGYLNRTGASRFSEVF